MYGNNDLHEFKKICEEITSPKVPENEDEERLDDGLEDDEIENLSANEVLSKQKEITNKVQRLGAELESLATSKEMPPWAKKYLKHFDKTLSDLYIQMYKFGHKLKEKIYSESEE